MPSGDARVRAPRVHAHGALVNRRARHRSSSIRAARAPQRLRGSVAFIRVYATRAHMRKPWTQWNKNYRHRTNEFKRHATHNAGPHVRNARRIWQLMWTPHPRSRLAPRGSRPARICICMLVCTRTLVRTTRGTHVHQRGPSLPQPLAPRPQRLSRQPAFASSTYIQSSVVASGCATLVPARAASRARIAAVNLSDAAACVSIDGRARCCDETLGRRKC